jgi:hypothetical protein
MTSPTLLAALADQHKGAPVGQCIAARMDELKKLAALPAPAQTASPAPPPPGSQVAVGVFAALVPPVTGAPGDGQTSLTAAIRRALQTRGVTLVDQALPKAHRVEGTVRLGTARAGKQAISIEWVVKNPRGARIGTVNQKNQIGVGSLDGAWGSTAEWAASAAAKGILDVLERNGTR